MKLLKFIFLCFFIQSNCILAQDFHWVRPYDGANCFFEKPNLIEVDSDENSYSVGIIGKPLFDIDPTSGSQIIDNTEQNYNQHCSIFLTKLDINGNFIWGRTFGSIFNEGDRIIDIKIGNDNNIYLLADIYEQTTFRQKFITIFKIDSAGNTLLTKKITNLFNPNYYDIYSSSSLAIDYQNNIFITGSFKYRFQIDNTNPQLDFNVGGDSFLIKINSLGTIVWGRTFDVRFTNTHYESVKIDLEQNPILVVSNGDNQNYTNYGYNVFKLNSNNGSIIWQKFLDNQNPITFNVDINGNIVIAGSGKNGFGGDIDVDPSLNQININPKFYILWLTNNGDYLEAKSYLSTSLIIRKIEFDEYNNVFVVGIFKGTFDADPSNSFFPLTYFCGMNGEVYESFCVKFDMNRNFESAFKLGSYNNNCINFYLNDVRIINNNQYYGGVFDGTVDFDPTINNYTLSSSIINPFNFCFTLKLGPCNTAIPVGNNNQSFCSSQNPKISNLSPNSSSIKWYDSATSTTQLSITAPLVNGQTYFASRQIGSCPESARLPVTVTINQSPSPPITNNQGFCESENATISDLIPTGVNIKWYASLTDTTELPSNFLLNTNNYYATQTINGCESLRVISNVVINSTSLPTLTSPQSFCIQQNPTLNSIAITGQNIKWYDAQTLGNLLPSSTILVNGSTYYASQTINSCESLRVPITINIQNTPAPTGNANQSFCATQNATLNEIVISGSTINWYSSPSSTVILPSTTLLVNGSTYYASQTINGCESVNRFAVTITLTTTLNATNYSKSFCDDLDDGLETILLTDYNSFVLSSTTNEVFTYYNSNLSAENQIQSDKINPNYTLTTGTHTVFVRIDSSNGCHQVVELNLTLFSNPVINLKDIIPICENKDITINAGNGFDSYTWSTGITNQQSILITQPGSYSLTVTKNNGSITCSSTKNFTVINSNIASISSIETSDWTDNQNTISVFLSSSSVGNYEYSLDGMKYQDSPIFDNLLSGFYTVYVNDKNNCGEITDEVFVLMYPTFFTPNNDGYNDYWKIKLSELEPGLNIKIFDRYGKFIKLLDNDGIGWDGTYVQKPLPADDYWFVITRANGKEYRNHFTLKR